MDEAEALTRLEVLIKKINLTDEDEKLVKEYLDEIDEALENKDKEPKETEKVEVSNFPKPNDTVNLKKPAWLPLAYAPLKPIKESLDEMNRTLAEISRKLDR